MIVQYSFSSRVISVSQVFICTMAPFDMSGRATDIYKHDPTWAPKFLVRLGLVVTDLVAIACLASCLAIKNGAQFAQVYFIFDAAVGAAAVSLLWSLITLTTTLVRRKPVAPGVQVGLSCYMLLTLLAAALAAIAETAYMFSGTSSAWSIDAAGFRMYATPVGNHRFPVPAWRQGTMAAACAFVMLAALLEGVMFVWACVDVNRRVMQRVYRDVCKVVVEEVLEGELRARFGGLAREVVLQVLEEQSAAPLLSSSSAENSMER